MSVALGLLTTIFAFLLLLGPLVVIHELGHYLIGRFFGVKADAFSIGFGKELAGWTDKRGTRWKLSMLPLGGYVQFAGDMNPASAPSTGEDGLSEAERAHTFHVKPLWQRALIVFAGPLTNLLVCVAILAGFAWANGRPVADPVIAGIAESSPAQAAGLEAGDRIASIDGHPIESASDIPSHVIYFPDQTIEVTVMRDGKNRSIPVHLARREVRDDFGAKAAIGELGVDFDLPIIGGFMEGSSAEAAGMHVGDRIVEVDGKAIGSFAEIPPMIEPIPGRTIPIVVEREGLRETLSVTVGSAERMGEDGKAVTIGLLGARADFGRVVPVGPLEAVGLGFTRSFDLVGTMVTGIKQIVVGQRSARELGGPIKIAQYSGKQFSLGWEQFTLFGALISINLAFINLLPIPGLDGGHLAFYAAEWVRRKPLGVRSQEWAIRTGVALVLALMLFVTVNDLVSLPIFGG